MSELISKEQAINALFEWEWDNKDDRDAVDVICGLPTINNEPHWIPIENEEPPLGKEVLVCEDGGEIWKDFMVIEDGMKVWYYLDLSITSLDFAWMPLPKSYRRKRI